jgi:hypothetical protein
MSDSAFRGERAPWAPATSHDLGGCCGSAAQNKLVGHDPQHAAVSLDDRTADPKSHSHPIGFLGEEWIEYLLHAARRYPCPCQRSNHYTTIVPELGTHGESARAVHGCHRLYGIRYQVEEHLQLNLMTWSGVPRPN